MPCEFKKGDRVVLVSPIIGSSLSVGAEGTVLCAGGCGAEVAFDDYRDSTFRIPNSFLRVVDYSALFGCNTYITDALAYSAKRLLDKAYPVMLHQGDAFEFKVDPGPFDSAALDKYIRWDEEHLRVAMDVSNSLNENKKEETPMNTMYTAKNCRVACISFNEYSDKTYSYALFLNDVEPGDRVVVRNFNGDLTIGTLARITDDGHDKVKDGCEVICVIDMTAFNKRQEQFAKAAALRKKMDARVKALQEISLYEMLAKDDPELADLLAEFKSVNG